MVAAKFTGFCWRCDGVFARGDEVVLRHGKWIHPQCAPGGSDE